MKLKRFNIWKMIGIVFIFCVIVFVITYTTTRSKYKYTESVKAAYGTIHWKKGDLTVATVFLEQSDGSYVMSDDIPTSGYALNSTKSYCAVSNGDGTHTNVDVTMTYHDGVMAFDNVSEKGTTCYLYFDTAVSISDMIASYTLNTTRSSGSITSTYTTSTSGTIFKGPADDYGSTTYFFAGSNPNNWVKFAGYYWRIIRINGDNSIRIIYNGTDTSTTGATTQISESPFNSSYNDNMYVGYMYTSGSVHGYGNSSTIKGVLDKWYQNNIAKYSAYTSLIATNVGFCGDRQPSTSSASLDGAGGTGTTVTYYASYIRAFNTHQFVYTCTTSSDLYTVSSSSYGNKALTYPIGLISMDEVAFAGAYGTTVNTSYWLYTNKDYWTMSPYYFDSNYVSSLEFRISSTGGFLSDGVSSSYGVRPVLNIKNSVKLSGSGTTDNPYEFG